MSILAPELKNAYFGVLKYQEVSPAQKQLIGPTIDLFTSILPFLFSIYNKFPDTLEHVGRRGIFSGYS